MFCPKCGSILMPKKDGNKKILACSCGYKSKDTESAKIGEQKQEDSSKIEVIDQKSFQTLPLMQAICPKCGHKKAFFWLVQTRAADEPETKFLKCEKCDHTWRDYD